MLWFSRPIYCTNCIERELSTGEEPQTWREFDIRDDVLAVVERNQVLQGVCVHNEKAAIIQTDCQGFAVRGEAAAAATCRGQEVY